MIEILLFAAGLAALVAGAELLVRGASRLAIAFGISPLVVGLTVVAFGTSAPEMAVTTGAVLEGNADIAVGNAVGSNIFNVLFILGLAALITPLAVHVQVIRQEAPIMIGGAVLLMVLSMDGKLAGFDSALLLALLVAYTLFLILQSRRETASEAKEFDDELTKPAGRSWENNRAIQLLMIVGGLVLLVLGARALVSAAVSFATALGVSDVVIGLTIVAAGTSLPEVAASVAAALKGERDIAVGNVVGSCVFNIFGVIGLGGAAALFAGLEPLTVAESVRNFDLWVMLAALFACLPVFLSGKEIARWEGAVFLLYYAAYTAYLVMDTQGHDALTQFSATMIGFVIPLTIVTLVVSLFKKSP